MDDTLYNAIREGLTNGGLTVTGGNESSKVQIETPQEHQSRLKAAYNAASGLIEGLSALRDWPRSEVQYSVSAMPEYDRVCISTNIPVGDNQTLSIDVESNGDICAVGYDTGEGYMEQEVTRNGKAVPIIKFVAEKAALKGFVK